MNYFHMLEELSEKHHVWLKSLPRGVWEADVSLLDDESGDVTYRIREKGQSPQEAIRKAYLAAYPIPRNTYSGKLKQT